MTNNTTPKLIIHGGAGRLEGNVRMDGEAGGTVDAYAAHRMATTRLEDFDEALREIAAESYKVLLGGEARVALLHAMRLLEDNPLFNAGTGSRIQSDGKVRMSAALMDGPGNRLSGVINVEGIRHPIDLADLLAAAENTVLAGELATAFARERGFAPHDPITPQRREEYEKLVLGRAGDMGGNAGAGVGAGSPEAASSASSVSRASSGKMGAEPDGSNKMGTVGAVVLDGSGRIWAATSTGGVGGEIPGRVSDAPTVAGTYATARMGVSCTGKGEQIVNQAAAARLAVRVDDGMALAEAVARTIGEADGRGYQFGLIALDTDGNIEVGQTKGVNTMFASHDGREIHAFLETLREGG